MPKREGWPSRSCRGEGNRLHWQAGGVQDVPGVGRGARGESRTRNGRAPPRRPTFGAAVGISRRRNLTVSGGSPRGSKYRRGPGKPGRGEGARLWSRLWLGGKAGGGKGPCFGRACGWG